MQHRSIFFAGMLTLVMLLSGCGSSSSGSGSSPCDDFDCQAMVDNLSQNIMLPTYESFESEASNLESAVQAYRNALSDGNPDTNDPALTNARDAWRETMKVWQRAEVMQVGPLLDTSSDLRKTIYSWPATSSCEVDQEVILAEDAGYDITDRSRKRRGLDALGYLLFTTTLDHTCSSSITVTQNWNSRPDDDRRATRADFMVLAAGDLHNQATDLVNQWQPGGGNFLGELMNPGTTGSRYDNVEQAVNDLSDALFYLEKQTNDTKLALPAGIKTNSCGDVGTVCLQDVESVFSPDSSARVSKENIRQNMLGFQLMFLGNDPAAVDQSPPGFFEFLAAQSTDGESVAQTMSDDLDQALVEVDAINGTLYDAVTNDLTQVETAHDHLGTVTRQLKNQFLLILGLTIPDASAGDGD